VELANRTANIAGSVAMYRFRNEMFTNWCELQRRSFDAKWAAFFSVSDRIIDATLADLKRTIKEKKGV
jgi:hypothetical protein